MRTSSSRRCTWMRAPSSFHSTDAGPTSASAASTAGAPDASIGCTPRPTSSPIPARPASPSVSATAATRPRSPESIAARRTSASGTAAARATASVMTPASAPWRSSPTKRWRRKSSSSVVARSNASRRIAWRRAVEPVPVVARMRSRRRSTSPTASDAVAAGSTSRSCTVAQPTPTRPWRTSPLRNPTPAAISSGPRRRRRSASAVVFAERARVAATAVDVATRSARSMRAAEYRSPRACGRPRGTACLTR
jgi:hypothetical protein